MKTKLSQITNPNSYVRWWFEDEDLSSYLKIDPYNSSYSHSSKGCEDKACLVRFKQTIQIRTNCGTSRFSISLIFIIFLFIIFN
jgi:hypothetical protein